MPTIADLIASGLEGDELLEAVIAETGCRDRWRAEQLVRIVKGEERPAGSERERSDFMAALDRAAERMGLNGEPGE